MTAATYTFPHPIDVPGILIATRNVAIRQQVNAALRQRAWSLIEAVGGADALDKLETSECRLLLMDRQLPDLDAAELSRIIADRFPGVDVLMVDGVTGVPEPARELQTETAHDLLRMLLAEPAPAAAQPLVAVDRLPDMIGGSDVMRKMYRATRLVAARETPVLLVGESGTGKELVAQAVHKLSRRADKPFLTINCAAIPESLLESELFGYVRGAFTGAAQSRLGRIHAAQGGTLFLDEIGDMPVSLQAKILRFLEQGEVQRLGSSDVFRVDVRVIAATNVDLEKKVAEQQFRKDLLYRLAVFPIALPALRNRERDVLELARHFLRQIAGPSAELSASATTMLQSHDWPGNVRELRHVIERASILADGQPSIGSEHIVLATCGA
jgi:transcriptional regulator with GAF, ATPase, and Fis domain